MVTSLAIIGAGKAALAKVKDVLNPPVKSVPTIGLELLWSPLTHAA